MHKRLIPLRAFHSALSLSWAPDQTNSLFCTQAPMRDLWLGMNSDQEAGVRKPKLMGLGWWAWARLGLTASADALQVLHWEEALTRLGWGGCS